MGTTTHAERRDASAPRRPFQTPVDVTPLADGERFKGDSIDLSAGGIAVRSAFLPEVGELVECRFDTDESKGLRARAEVVWTDGRNPLSGAFGARFVELPADVEDAVRRVTDETSRPAQVPSVKATAPTDETKVKLFIQGMDAPLRARVRTRQEGAMIVGSDLSFLKLGEKVEVEAAAAQKVSGTIETVEVEVDSRTRVPRLVLTIETDPAARKRAAEAAAQKPNAQPTPTKLLTVDAGAREVARPPRPRPAAREKEDAVTKPALEDATRVAEEKAAPMPLTRPARRPTNGTNVIGAKAEVSSEPEIEEDENLDDAEASSPGWFSNGLTAVRGAVGRLGETCGPVVQGLSHKVKKLATARRNASEDVQDEAPPPRRGLRPQHAAPSAQSSEPDATTTQGRRGKRVAVYAAGALAVAAGVVAIASTAGPRTEPPRPQVAVTAETATTEGAPAPEGTPATPENVDPSASPEPGATPRAAQPEPRWVTGQNPRSADLAAAAGSSGAQVENEPPVFRAPPARPRANTVAARVASPPPAITPALRPVTARSQVVIATPTRPVVFGNPAVRSGTVLRLRMDGPVSHIGGVGARGAAIVLNLPGRQSLDMAAPLARLDPRIAGAGVINRATGAELTLRFREAAPPFVARSRGDAIEIVLAPPPGAAAQQAALHPRGLGRR